MKLFGLIFLTLMSAKGCSGEQQKDMASAVVEYVATTRGSFYKATISDKKALVSQDRRGNGNAREISISDSDWESLAAEFSKVDLASLESLKAPSNKHTFDGAAIATLTITYKGQTYKTPAFDHGNPPSEIKEIVEKITALALRSE